MATGKVINYKSIEVVAAGGASGSGTTYTLTLNGKITAKVTENTDPVENNQTVTNSFAVAIDCMLYDLSALSDAHIQTDSTTVTAAKIFLNGADSGSGTHSIDNIRLRATQHADGQKREYVQIQGSITLSTNPIIFS